jgi:SAM-dependent methyltransferase
MSAPRDVLHAYWREPWDGRNGPQTYTDPGANERSRFLVGLLGSHVPTTASVLEIGCNAGRNLKHLHDAGYEHLSGLDIAADAVALMRETYPDLAAVPVTVAPMEDALRDMDDDAFGAVFTMAVLEHVHPDSAWVFEEMARIAGTVVTVEDEQLQSWRHFPRNYRTIFEALGLTQTEAVDCRKVKGLGRRFVARVFVR